MLGNDIYVSIADVMLKDLIDGDVPRQESPAR